MARTGMLARGLRAVRRMARGADSTVYVLVKTTGADSLTSVGSTADAHVERRDDGTATLRLTEDSTLTATVLRRAAGFAIASSTSGYRIWRRMGEARQAYGEAARDWLYQIGPTGEVFTAPGFFGLEDGSGVFALEDGSGYVGLEA